MENKDTSYNLIEENRRELIDEIIRNIESGDLTFNDLWSRELARPQNPISGAKYNGGNRLRLGYQAVLKGYQDNRWITFVQAKKEGLKLKEGQKATGCEKWIYTRELKEENKKGEIEKKIIKIKPIGSKFNVFNGEQFQNMPEYIPEAKVTGNEKNKIIDILIESSECEVRIVGQDRAFYMPSEDIIAMPLLKHFYNNDNAIGTLLHEMAHSTGHKDRLNRDKDYSKASYAREELVAEISAIFLEQDLGLELTKDKVENYSAYLKSWLQMFKEDPNEIFRAVVEAEKSSNRILENYNKQLEKEKKLIKESTKEYQEKNPKENIVYADKYRNGELKTLVKENKELYIKEIYRETGLLEKEELFSSINLKTLCGDLIGEKFYSKEKELLVERTYSKGELTKEINHTKGNYSKNNGLEL